MKNIKNLKIPRNINDKYYKDNYKSFTENTINADMSKIYNLFEKYIHEGYKILDIGFGSARDMIYLQNKYDVYGIDIVTEFVNLAKEKGLKVEQKDVKNLDYNREFDAIWACASLLHIEEEKLPDVFKRCYNSLKDQGIMYVSFKYGDYVGERNGRYFVDANIDTINKYLIETDFKVMEYLITDDVRENRDDRWFNVILKKV